MGRVRYPHPCCAADDDAEMGRLDDGEDSPPSVPECPTSKDDRKETKKDGEEERVCENGKRKEKAGREEDAASL